MNQLTLLQCSKRKLDETYLVVYAIKNQINIKKGDFIEKVDIYSLIGIDIKGFRQFLNIFQDRVNNNRFWLDCFESLKSRGLKNILFLSVDDNKNMKRTAKIAFPNIIFVDSVTSIVPKFYKYTVEKDAKKLASKIHMLYTLRTLEDCKNELNNFSNIYNNAIHKKLIQKYLSNLDNTYKFSQNIRFLLFKHSANMELYDRIRLCFDSNHNYILEIDEIYSKLGDLSSFFGFTSFKKREWTSILNDLIQLYPNFDFI